MRENEWSLDELMQNFIDFKRSQGYSYEHDAYHLFAFKNLCSSMGCHGIPGKKEFHLWMMRKPSELPQSQHRRVSSARGFHVYLQKLSIDTGYVLPKNKRTSSLRHRPHFFSANEIYQFFKVCDTLKVRKENLGREIILPTAFRLIYCCGLRPIEAIRLKMEHVNLQEGYVNILASKCHKDRRLYLTQELMAYLAQYRHDIERAWPECTYFFPKDLHNRFGRGYLRSNFKVIWSNANKDSLASQVRVYDLRHHFALTNLNRWIQEGKNVDSMILYLMKFMGHASLDSTYYYLHLIPEFFPIYTHMTSGLSGILPEVDDEA
jgi:integrase